MSVGDTDDKPIRELFLKALDLTSPAERDAYLEQACGPNIERRAKVEALLKSHLADSFLEQPAVQVLQTAAATGTPSEGPGTVIDKYKVLEKLGEGGFGVVYMAEQTQPVKRRVALKIIKVGMDTREVVGRFEAERQALALMDHPNIAKVLDGGATEAGRPYFVMELVRGTKLTDYCDEKNLPTQERLGLFIQVCQAVQHAHQKGIIHRDLKPSNILVTVNDGVAVPKIIDFGIAKATQMELSEKTVFTRFLQFLGTPVYMSPEQAELTSVDIDTRSDIYSLGVLLYELLTGKTPFDSKELLRVGLDEMRRTIREKEPPTPSTRVSTMQGDELTTTAQRRGIEPPKLINTLRGDLDWIVMKCLEKDRARRYETANGLAMDVQRHLNNEAVLASPPSTLYRFQKLVRRNRAVLAAGAIIFTLLVLGVGAITWEAVRARRAEREQTRSRQQAQTEAAKAQEVARFLKGMLEGVHPRRALGRDTTILREILDDAAKRAATDLTNQPDVEAELLTTIGAVYGGLGQNPQAEEMIRRALALRRSLFGNENLDVADSLDDLSGVLGEEEKYSEGEVAAREALAIQRKLRGPEHRMAWSLNTLGVCLDGQGKYEEAETMYRDALAMRRKLLSDKDPDLACSLNNLSGVLSRKGDLPGAEKALREAITVMKKHYGPENPYIEVQLDNLAKCLIGQGKFAEGEACAREALGLQKTLFGSDFPHVIRSLWILNDVLRDQHKLAELEAVDRELLAATRKQPGDDQGVLNALNNLGGLLSGRQDKLAECEALNREALALTRKVHGGEDPEVATALDDLVSVLQREAASGEAANLTEADALARESLALCEKRFPDDWRTFRTRSLLGGSLLKQKRYEEAEPLLLSGYEGLTQHEAMLPSWGKTWLVGCLKALEHLCEATGRADQAAEWKKKLAEFESAQTNQLQSSSAPGKSQP
jgi:serine/threonine protein kinase/tetratricopeptide (TPR) repeat protein